MSAEDILAIVNDLSVNPRVLTGTNILRVQGPGGEWRIRMEKNSRGNWTFNVYSSDRRRFYSLQGVKRALNTLPDDALATAPHEIIPSPEVHNASSLPLDEVAVKNVSSNLTL